MRLLLACLTCVVLAGCGPRYVQDYDLFPPANAAGKQCVTECVVAKEQCEKECYMSALQCERMNNWDTYGGIGYGYGRRGHGYWDSQFGTAFPSGSGMSCGNNGCLQVCRGNQLQCHQNCGGTIKERAPRCVSGCG